PALARAVPVASAVVVVVAGLLQFTAWKARHLACCGDALRCGQTLAPHGGAAWRHGLRLGGHCVCCCAGLTAVLLVLGVMDLRVMGAVTAAITVERLAPNGARVARFVGVTLVAAGLFLITRAAGASPDVRELVIAVAALVIIGVTRHTGPPDAVFVDSPGT